MKIFPQIEETISKSTITLKSLTNTQVSNVLDELQKGKSYVEIKHKYYIPTDLIKQIEVNAREVVKKVLSVVEKAKVASDITKVSVGVDREDLIKQKMIALSSPDGKGTLTTLKEAVGIEINPIKIEPVDGGSTTTTKLG